MRLKRFEKKLLDLQSVKLSKFQHNDYIFFFSKGVQLHIWILHGQCTKKIWLQNGAAKNLSHTAPSPRFYFTGEIIGHKPVIKLNRFEAVMFWVVEATRCRKHEKIERNIKTIKDRFLRGLCLSKQDSKPHYFSIKKYGLRCRNIKAKNLKEWTKFFCLIIFFLTRTGLSLTWLLSTSIKIFVIYKLFIYFYSLHLRRSCFVHELLSRIVLVWFLCIFFFNFLAHFIKIFDDLSPLL